MTNVTTSTIRDLNDAVRSADTAIGALLANGQLVITRGVASKGNAFIDRAVKAVREFSDFTEDNDPHGEHDFGIFELDGETLNWKIDYYDRDLQYGSDDPSDPGENAASAHHPVGGRILKSDQPSRTGALLPVRGGLPTIPLHPPKTLYTSPLGDMQRAAWFLKARTSITAGTFDEKRLLCKSSAALNSLGWGGC